MHKQIILVIFISFISKFSLADWAVQGIEITCKDKLFKVTSYNLVNEDPSSNIVSTGNGVTRYFGNDEHSVTCKIGKKLLKPRLKQIHQEREALVAVRQIQMSVYP